MAHPMILSWQFGWQAAGRSPRTMTEMRRFVERFEVVLTEQGRDLTTATRGNCEEFLASLPTPCRRQWGWRSLRSFYGVVSEELEQPSPMARIKSPKVPLTDVTVASEDDVSRMLRACSPWRTATNVRDAAIISTLWSSGVRRSELANLRFQDLDLNTMTIVIVKSKAGRPRRAPLDERTVQHLLRWLAERATYPVQHPDALWLGKNGPLSSDGIRQVLERRRKQAGVNLSAHAFRRGFAAHALRNGVSQASLMVAAGWTTPTMPSLYTRSVAEDVMIQEFRNKLGKSNGA